MGREVEGVISLVRSPTILRTGQLKNNATVVVLRCRGRQIKFCESDLATMSGSQVVEQVSDYCVILDLELMAIFEDQDSLRLIGLRRYWLRNLCSCSRLTLPFIALASVNVAVLIIVAVGPTGTTAVKNRWPTTVVIFHRFLFRRLNHDDRRERHGVNGHGYGESRETMVVTGKDSGI